jgi:hypothetical protein
MNRLSGWVAVALLLSGCASVPNISQLNQDVRTVAFVKNGTRPLNYSTGVVDAASFWAAYGGGVSSNLGGSLIADSLQSSGASTSNSKADQNREMVKRLFGDHGLARKVNDALLPQLADVWGVQYDEANVVLLTDKIALADPQTGVLQGVETNADLILMIQVENVNLTERLSMGGALAAGFTMGMNKKALTTEATVAMRAFKRDPQLGGYKQVWHALCGPNYTTMKTSYLLSEITESPARMTEILDEAAAQSVEICSKTLGSIKAANLATSQR